MGVFWIPEEKEGGSGTGRLRWGKRGESTWTWPAGVIVFSRRSLVARKTLSSLRVRGWEVWSMRYFILTLVLAVLAWFGYDFLAGKKESRAAGRNLPASGEVLSTTPMVPGGGISEKKPVQGETPGSAGEKAGSAPAPAPSSRGEIKVVERLLGRGDLKSLARMVREKAPDLAGNPKFRSFALQGARKALEKGDAERAARILTDLLDAWTRGPLGEKDLAEFERASALLRRVMNVLLFNPGGAWRSRTYLVKRGDVLERIARRFGRAEGYRVTPGFLEAVNRITARRLRAGQKLRIPLGRLHVVVEKKSFVLKLFLDDVLIRIYRVGLGKDGKTPSADFTVLLKQKNPVWWNPTKGPIPHGHPDNPLGDYFIKLKSDRYTGFGIHGTRPRDRDTIGKEASQGCVRMLPEDIEELFAFLPKGAEVKIR